MVKKGLKRRVSDEGHSGEKKIKIAVENSRPDSQSSEEIIKEFVGLVNVKQTRLKGLTKFLKAIQQESKTEVVLRYLQTHPNCLELFNILDERTEERSLLEVQLVLQILESFLLHLAEGDLAAKSKSTVIITSLLAKHRKLVYSLLNSSSPAKVVMAMLGLLTAIVMQGSSFAKELLATFDFSHKTFTLLVNRRDKKGAVDVRTCLIKFLLSFFIGGDQSLIQKVLEIKGFATSMFKNFHMDSPEVIHLVLSTLLVKIVENSSILKKTKILLFTSYSLTQLVKLYNYSQDNLAMPDTSVRDTIHNFMLKLCTSKFGIAFDNELGIFSARSNNPVLLRFLHSLPKTNRDELLVELVIKILLHAQDLISPYLLDCQMALEPRNSEQWSKNFLFLIKVYYLLPQPSLLLNTPGITHNACSVSKMLQLVCPLIIKRNILTRGLLHSDVLVQTTTLSMMLVILRRSIDLMRCKKADDKTLATFNEDILKLLPSFQTLISIRQNLDSRTRTARDVAEQWSQDVEEKDSLPQVSAEDAKPLLSRTLAAISLYQIVSPNCFTHASYDPWKLLPKNEQEEGFYNSSSMHSVLQTLLNLPSGDFKWQLQSRGEHFGGFRRILVLYSNGENAITQELAKDVIRKIFLETYLFDKNEEEISFWLRNMLHECIEESKASVIKFLDEVYSLLADDPYELVDAVIESTSYVTLKEGSCSAHPKECNKRFMVFSPLVAGSLKLFSQMIKEEEKQENLASDLDGVARFLNLVFLDILTSQTYPRPLCNIVTKYLVKGEVIPPSLPAHTRALLYFLGHWCPVLKKPVVNDDQSKLTRKLVKQLARKQDKSEEQKLILTLTLQQFKESLSSIIGPRLLSGSSDDIGIVVTYLTCNPVPLFDCLSFSDFIIILKRLPTSLILQQLMMFLLECWKAGTDVSDTTLLWNKFEEFSTALISSMKRKNAECWDRTVSGCLFLVSNLIQLYLTSPGNKRIFLEINRTITEILRTVFHRLRKKDIEQIPESCSSIALSKEVGNHEYGDVLGIVGDVIQPLEVPQKGGEHQETIFRFITLVFDHSAFKDWFYRHASEEKQQISPTSRYVSLIVSDCIAYLMNDFQTEILNAKDCEFWKPYFLRVTHAVKQEATSEGSSDMNLPFSVEVTSLLRVFCDHVPVTSLSEAVLRFLDVPQEQMVIGALVETREQHAEREKRLSDKGKLFVALLDCFLSKGRTCSGLCISSPAVERVIGTLAFLECDEADELIPKSVMIFPEISDQAIVSVLLNCLNHPTPVRVDTAVLLLSDRPSLVYRFEEHLLNYCKQRRNDSTMHDGKRFLEKDFQWKLFLPLLNLYLLSVIKDKHTRTHRTKECVKYLAEVSWQKLKEWLLGEKPKPKYGSEKYQLILRLLEVQESEYIVIQNSFNDATKRNHSLNWDLFQLQAVESLLQSILKQTSQEKEKRKCRTNFVLACMERLSNLQKRHGLQVLVCSRVIDYLPLKLDIIDDETLRTKMLCFLENHAKEPLRLKKNEYFSSDELMNAASAFVKSSLRSWFFCAQTLRVLSVIVKAFYQCDTKKASLLVPLTDLYQFILSHSKFFDIFFARSDDTELKDDMTKCALIDLLQTIVDLQPKCCNPSHVSLFLGAYGATLRLADQKLLHLLCTYESLVGGLAVGSRVLWGEAAIEAHEANKGGASSLWHQPNIDQVLDLLDAKLLLQSAKHFPIHKKLQPEVCMHHCKNSLLYDPSFLLPLFSFFMASGCEVNCRKFVERSALAYTISALTSSEQLMRQVAYQILSRFSVHLSASSFREKQQVSHLLHCFRSGITEANSRISSLIVSFMARALHIFFYPEDPLYISVNSYMLRRAFMDLKDVPLFLSLINSSNLDYCTERTWLIHFLLDGLRDPMDYYICKRYHVVEQLLSLYCCSVADKHLQGLILKVLRQLCLLPVPAYDLCHNYGVVSWLHFLVTNHSTLPEHLHQVLDILGVIWFTLIGEESREDSDSEESVPAVRAESHDQPHPLPRNICPELLLVCLSILQRICRSEIWNQDVFVPFMRLLASLLSHQNTVQSETKVVIAERHMLQISRIWMLVFGAVDILSKFKTLYKGNSRGIEKKCDLKREMWFRCLTYTIRVLNFSQPQKLFENSEDQVDCDLYRCLGRPVERFAEIFLEMKLRPIIALLKLGSVQGYGKELFERRNLANLDSVLKLNNK